MAIIATPSTTPSSFVSVNEPESTTLVVGIFDFGIHGKVIITKVVTGTRVQYYATLNYCSVLRWKFSCDAGKDKKTGREQWIFFNFQLLECDFPGKDRSLFRTEVEIACIDPSRYLEVDSEEPNFPVLRCVIRFDVIPTIPSLVKKAECYAKWRRNIKEVTRFDTAERKELTELVRRCNFPFGEMAAGWEDDDSEPEMFQMEM
ncbi:hypothetical protein LZ554_008091 [Drepanopeziza brunnea f. sp. 'monogermtubi']|nr:hypothetical protein LZ554_008091 [Drepanopeziza brunnea f. sp. 'monogermtubi']